MAGITQAQAETQLAAALAALADARDGELEIKDRKSKPASLKELQDEVKFWDDMVREKAASGSRTGPTMKGATSA